MLPITSPVQPDISLVKNFPKSWLIPVLPDSGDRAGDQFAQVVPNDDRMFQLGASVAPHNHTSGQQTVASRKTRLPHVPAPDIENCGWTEKGRKSSSTVGNQRTVSTNQPGTLDNQLDNINTETETETVAVTVTETETETATNLVEESKKTIFAHQLSEKYLEIVRETCKESERRRKQRNYQAGD